MEAIRKKHDLIKQVVQEINDLTAALTENRISFFDEISIPVGYASGDGCFKDLVNWLYSLYIEACGPNIKFFDEKLKIYGITLSKNVGSVAADIHTIRTVSSHNLLSSNRSDRDKQRQYEEFFSVLIAKNAPEQEDDYKNCANYLLDAVLEYMIALKRCIVRASEDEHFSAVILVEWQRKNDRDYSSHDFELVLISKLEEFGILEYLNPLLITKAEISNWKKQLTLLQDGFDFKQEAGRIIEKYIVTQRFSPVEAKDLLLLGVDNKKLRVELTKVNEEFFERPRSKDELLQWYSETHLS